MGRDACHRVQPEFDTHDPCGRQREPVLTSCPLTITSTHTHTDLTIYRNRSIEIDR